MRGWLLRVWYILLFVFLVEFVTYGVIGYLATGYRDLIWQNFSKAVYTLHDIDNRLPYAGSVNHYARDAEINPRVIASLIQVESSFQSRALSPAGAYGLMQIMPDTWRQVNQDNKVCFGRHKGECTSECYYNGDLNIQIGTKYLCQLLKKYQGNIILALAAYNAGPGAVERYHGVPPYVETENYIEGIISNWYMIENENVPYPTMLLMKQWDKAHQVIGWCLVITAGLMTWTVWRLVKRQGTWRWR